MKNKLISIDHLRDFNFIIQKLNEFEHFKKLFLNEGQTIALHYIKNKDHFSHFNNSDEESENKLCNYFGNLLSDDPLSGYDEILFSKLDDKIKTKIFKIISNDSKLDKKDINK
jgi:hypothetical protein